MNNQSNSLKIQKKMNEEKKNKAFKPLRAGQKVKKKEEQRKKKNGESDEKKHINNKGFMAPKSSKDLRRSLDIEENKTHKKIISRNYGQTPPTMIAVVNLNIFKKNQGRPTKLWKINVFIK
jgi:hypothetical protein